MFFWFSVHLSHPHKRNVLGTPWRNPLKFGKNIHLDSRSSDIVIQPYVCPILPWTQSWTMDLGKFGYSCLQGIEVMVLGFSSVDFLIDVDHIGSCFTFGFQFLPVFLPLFCTPVLHLSITPCVFKFVFFCCRFVCFHPACPVLLCLFAGPCVFPVFLICSPTALWFVLHFCIAVPWILFVTSFLFTCILDFGLQLSRCVSLGASFHARPCNTSHLCTKNQNRQHPLATTHSLAASDWTNATCRPLLWDFKPDQPSDSFGKFLVYFKNIKKLALQNVFQKTCYMVDNPCSCRTCLHFNSTMLSFVIICQECLVMSLKTQQDTTTVCCTASYIHNDWEPWKWRILWTHTFIKKVAFCCPTCLPLCLWLGHLNRDKII